MKTIAIWYLVYLNSNGAMVFSPPMKTQEECVRIQEVLPIYGSHASKCIQINEVVKELNVRSIF